MFPAAVGCTRARRSWHHEVAQVSAITATRSRYYDELWGGKNIWKNLGNPNLWDLLAVRYLVLPKPQQVPGFDSIAGPVPIAHGGEGFLYERDTVPPYARVVAAAAKVPAAQIVPTVVDQRFPPSDIVLYPDTASVTTAPLTPGSCPPRPPSRRR